MYKLSFTDRTVILVTTEQGDKIKEAQMQKNPPNYIDVDNNQYKLDKVTKIEYLPEQKLDKLLPESPRCHGEKSIHLVIYEAYKKRLREGKHLDWETFRQKTYDYIYEQKPDVVWCDNKKGTCVCEQTRAVERVKEVMGEVQVIS